ncbi:MAG: glycerol-3-phosphate dehydrogenase/oxidase [Verrucomicrobia bacterium]|nr:glycerol-3-phosphate dehydrogenase/oxidase [Verrucomicrobiota bacterium]
MMTMNWREQILQELKSEPQVSVLILGGGINGAGLFRELALQGVDCLLVDKNDFSAGATSKSSRMIHGGLRYLENREFKLVEESLLERNRLLENAAHYVAPLKTTIPLTSWFGGLIKSALIFFGFNLAPGSRGVVPIKCGLTFYDLVTRKNPKTPRHFVTSKQESLRATPGLRTDIVATATYWDAWITQAERLCIELIQDGVRAEPRCRAINYVSVAGVKDDGVVLKDEISGETVAVRPRVVVNATGGWVDKTNAALGLATRYMGPTKGSHLVVDNNDLHRALDGRMVYYQYDDGRVCIVFPFLDKVIMGSTDIRVEDPDTVRCDEAEIEYMLTTLRSVFPGLTITREQIVFAFCGVRPLPRSGKDVTAIVSRGHSVRADEPANGRAFPIYSLIGGKWTTFRAFAEQVADRLMARLGVQRKCSTGQLPIGGGKDFPADPARRSEWIRRVAQKTGLTEARVTALFERYGTAAETYATADKERPLQMLPSYTAEEIERIVANEFVVHLTDLTCRRSLIALLGDAREPILRELADIAAPMLGWDAARKEQEVKAAGRWE